MQPSLGSRTLALGLVAMLSLTIAPSSQAETCIGGNYNPNALSNVCYDSYWRSYPIYTVTPTTTDGDICVIGYLCPGVEMNEVAHGDGVAFIIYAEATALCGLKYVSCRVTVDTGVV